VDDAVLHQGRSSERKGRIWKSVTDEKQRAAIVDFAPLKGASAGELAANFDIVMGFTPAADAPAAGEMRFGIQNSYAVCSQSHVVCGDTFP
jgi:hypothetical protein